MASTAKILDQITANNRSYWNAFSQTLSDSTRIVYRSDILNYMLFIDKDITLANASDMRNYREHLHKNGASNATINKKTSAIRSLYNHLIECDVISENPLSDIKLLDSVVVREKNPLTWQKVQQCKDLGGIKFDVFNAAYSLGLTIEKCAKHLDMSVGKYQYYLKKLADEICVHNLTYSDLIETRNKFFATCPSCGKENEMCEGNWKFQNGLMICINC